jgi:hypothetical protein
MTQAVYNDNTNGIPKKSNLKQVQIGMFNVFVIRIVLLIYFLDPQISSVNIPKKIYCIHITNLPSNATAEILSKKFSWSMGSILINLLNNQSLSIECWLKGIDQLKKAKDFVQQWNGQMILRSKIQCEIEEDKLELCNKFRIGQCSKTSEDCDWEHIMCTANGKCSNDCLYGHEEGMKTGYINNCK